MLTILIPWQTLAEVPAPQPLDVPGFRSGVYQVGDLYLSGQPTTETALNTIKSMGITTVINLRTHGERSNKSTPINEEAWLIEADIRYIHIPSGGPNDFTPQQLQTFADAMDEHHDQGPILLHCNSGRRAAHMWVAYLVKHRGLSMAEALEHGRQLNFGKTPIEGYLGDALEFDYSPVQR